MRQARIALCRGRVAQYTPIREPALSYNGLAAPMLKSVYIPYNSSDVYIANKASNLVYRIAGLVYIMCYPHHQ